MTTRIYNFGAGPAMLPEPILKKAQEELLNWHGSGMSVMEIGHRTEEFAALMNHAEQSLRTLLNIPHHYQVLFLGGAARTQFAMIPMNFLHPKEKAGYILTGIWSEMAYKEALLLKNAYCVATEEANQFRTIPNKKDLILNGETTYLYYTPNETINGVRFPYVPQVNDIPLIADMTSCFLSEPIDVRQYGLIFAGAQKNIANAGLTVAIIREDLLERAPNPVVPTMLNYKIQTDNHSLYATPPGFNCYLAAQMFDWLIEQGGIDALYEKNCLKAAKLYQYLDTTEFYISHVAPEARSIMNVCFSIKESTLENKFLLLAKERGLCALKGHRLVGGLRASLYNSMTIEGVNALVEFMKEFEEEHQ